MRTAAVKPVFHSLLTTYLHPPVVAALLLELLARLDELFELELTTELLKLEDFELELVAGELLTTLLELLLFTLDATLLLATLVLEEELAPTMP